MEDSRDQTRQLDTPDMTRRETMLCNHCGVSNEMDAKFCMNCGESLDQFRRVKLLLHDRWSKTRFKFHQGSLFQPLFDMSFEKWINFKIIRLTYGLSILVGSLIAVLTAVAGFHVSMLFGIVTLLIGTPLIFFLTVLYSRIHLETFLASSRRIDRKVEAETQPESIDEIEWNV